MLTYDLITHVYPVAFAAARCLSSHEDNNRPHRPRLTSSRKVHHQVSGGHKSRRRSLQQDYTLVPDSCDPTILNDPADPFHHYHGDNNNQSDILDLNQLKVRLLYYIGVCFGNMKSRINYFSLYFSSLSKLRGFVLFLFVSRNLQKVPRVL